MTARGYCSLSGNLASKCELWIPMSGTWVADVSLSAAAGLTGNVTLEIGDLSLFGTIIRGGAFAGSESYRVVGGYGGWLKRLPAKSYQHDAGVRYSVVLGDAAKACGEVLSLAADGQRGPNFVRPAGPAVRSFGAFGLDWFVQADGSTRTGARPAGTFTQPFQVLQFDRANGKIMLSTEAPKGLLPGVSFKLPDGTSTTAQTVCHSVSKGQARVEVWTA